MRIIQLKVSIKHFSFGHKSHYAVGMLMPFAAKQNFIHLIQYGGFFSETKSQHTEELNNVHSNIPLRVRVRPNLFWPIRNFTVEQSRGCR